MKKPDLKPSSYPGLFIAFEGLDGSGQSTQVEKLAQYLREQGKKCLTTKEPTNNLIGGLIRGQLTHEWTTSQECLQLLFSADRAHHLEREILPALKAGKIVITDRYFFSTIAFGSLDIDALDWLIALNQRFVLPDLVFLIRVSPKECVRRIQTSRHKTELFEQEKKLRKVWRAYAKLAKMFPNIHVINGEQEIDKVFANILRIIRRKTNNFAP